MDRELRLFRVCRGCKIEKPTSEFYPTRAVCRECLSVKRTSPEERKRYRDWWNKPETNRRIKANRRRSRYRMSDATFDGLMEAQGRCCAICRGAFVDTPAVDHDHQSGANRGLLCHQCNRALGGFRDDPGILLAAIAYLRLHRSVAA